MAPAGWRALAGAVAASLVWAASGGGALLGCASNPVADAGLLGGALLDLQFYGDTLPTPCLASLLGGQYEDACVASVPGVLNAFQTSLRLTGYTTSLFTAAQASAAAGVAAELADAYKPFLHHMFSSVIMPIPVARTPSLLA